MTKNNNFPLQKIVPRILTATVKAITVLILFLIFSQLLAPIREVFPEIQALIGTFAIAYIALIVLTELTKDTIYQYVLNMGKAFFFIGYSILALKSGTIAFAIESATLTVGLQFFLVMIVLIGILDFAKGLLQIIDYMTNKAEKEEIAVALPEQEIPAH